MARRDPAPSAGEPQSVREVALSDSAAATSTAPAGPVEDEAAAGPPAYYIATRPLFLGGDQFNRAFNAGDRVPADHVEAYGWADMVRRPDQREQPPAAPQTMPETASGQATSKEGDA